MRTKPMRIHWSKTTVTGFLALAEQHNCQGLKDAWLDFRKSLREEEETRIRTRLLALELDDTLE